MTADELREIVDRIVAALEGVPPALEGLSPEPSPVYWWVVAGALAPYLAVAAALLAAFIAWKNLKTQQEALGLSQRNHDDALDQKREADARAEWWRRTQWAIDAAWDPATYPVAVAVLQVQAKSNLASPEELDVIAAVLAGVLPSGLDDEGIDQLIEEAEAAGQDEGLTAEEEAALRRYYNLDDPENPVHNEGGKEETP